MYYQNRWSAGLTLVALIPLAGCVAPWLDTETEEVVEYRLEPTGTEEAMFKGLEQSGATVAGFFECVTHKWMVRYSKRNRRIPTKYAGGLSPEQASLGYCVFLPLTLIGTFMGYGSCYKPVEWEAVEGRFRREGKARVVDQGSYPISAARVEWELGLADGPVAGLVVTDADGRFTISFGQSWGAIRASLDRMDSADLRLEAVDAGAVGSIPIDLLQVNDAIMRKNQ